MHEPYDEDDGYDDEDYYNYDDNDQYDPYKFYFKFDVGADSPISDMINKWFNLSQDSFNGLHWYSFPTNIDGWPVTKFPVNSYIPNTGDGTKSPFLYLGNNYQNQPIWKNAYLVKDKVNILYKNHISQHSVHFLKQPTYYKGMFDILN